jgi:NAD(P)-dependent dehydrogenase (short-subunit alcohol dehydrogenase family)
MLLFIDDSGLGLQLGQRLQKQGHHITFVKKSSEFSTTGEPDTYTIAPGRADHYDMLLKNLQEKQKVPQSIFHLWGVTGSREGSMDIEAINDFLESGFYSLLYLAKAIGNRNLLEEIQLLAITDNLQEVTGQEVLQPEKAVISAACKVISQEYSNITCRDIDIILPGASQREKLIRQLSGELYIESTDTVVYRGNYRWTRVYEPILLPESITRFSRLKQGGVYLITGGLGGIGFVLARYLAQQYRAKLILTGRTVLPPREQWERLLSTRSGEDPVNRKIRKLQELGTLGAELLTFSVDAADEAGMRQAISRAEERFGPINGVIHTAGHVERDTISTISDINMSQARLHFQAKLHGLLVLNEIFANGEKTLDFCLLMSSISSVLGGLGLAAYAAANSFMDAFVYWQNRQNHGQWISVNWDGWRTPDTPEHERFSAAAWEDFAMSPEEGIEAVQRILSMDDPIHVVHSTGDLPARIKQWLSLESLRKTHRSSTHQNPAASYPRPSLSTPYMAPRNKLERMIADVWQQFLGIGQVGTDDNFFDLNATSLDIVRVNSILRDVLKEDIPVITMFNYPTIGSLARFLSQQETEEAAPHEEMNREEVIAESQDRMRKMRERHVRQING